MQFRATEDVRELKAQCLLKLAPKLGTKESQLFLKWWVPTHADAGIHSIEWENRSEAEHHFLRVKLLTWWEKMGNSCAKSSQRFQINAATRRKTVRSLGGIILARIEHLWPLHPSVLSGCFPSSSPPPAHRLETADESQGRVALRTPTCESHSPCDPLLPGGSARVAQPSSVKNPILAKVEIGQVKSIVYFILP